MNRSAVQWIVANTEGPTESGLGKCVEQFIDRAAETLGSLVVSAGNGFSQGIYLFPTNAIARGRFGDRLRLAERLGLGRKLQFVGGECRLGRGCRSRALSARATTGTRQALCSL